MASPAKVVPSDGTGKAALAIAIIALILIIVGVVASIIMPPAPRSPSIVSATISAPVVVENNKGVNPFVFDKIVFGNENGEYNTNTGVYTAKKPGYYYVNVSIRTEGVTGNTGELVGAIHVAGQVGTGSTNVALPPNQFVNILNASKIVRVEDVTTDVITFNVWFGSASVPSVTVPVHPQNNIQVYYLRPL